MPTMTVRKAEPSEVFYKGFTFLITDKPNDTFMDKYIDELKKHNVTQLVRVCEPTYDEEKLNKAGIRVIGLPFDDGTGPPVPIIEQFLEVAKETFKTKQEATIAVHCVAGLGRAPVMVAIALIELGMSYEDAVELIRKQRRGAINAKQLCFLEKYKSRNRLKDKKNNPCLLM